MALQYSAALRTAQVACLQTVVGAAGNVKIFSGAVPANVAAADPSGLLITIALPATFLTSAAGVTTLAGIWAGTASTGTTADAMSFRMYDGSNVCHTQGTVTVTNGGGDMTINNLSIASAQAVSVTAFSVSAANT